jgi:putative phosphoribosyl transferase
VPLEGQTRPVAILFRDRADAGRALAAAIVPEPAGNAVVVGLARGGVAVAAEVARRLSLPLDAVAVRKIGYPGQPEYGIGAVAPGDVATYVRTAEDLDEWQLARAIDHARAQAEALDRTLHEHRGAVDLRGRTALLVDDGLATGATMVAAVRWARSRGATRVVVAVPVAAAQSMRFLRGEADELVCLHELRDLGSVGAWYLDFAQVESSEVIALLDEFGSPGPPA